MTTVTAKDKNGLPIRKDMPSKRMEWFARRQLRESLSLSLELRGLKEVVVFSLPPIILIVALNAVNPPKLQLRPLHPLHKPSIDPTYHLESLPAKFFFISYIDPSTGLCLKGPDDFYLVIFWIFVWTAMREMIMRFVWGPIAKALKMRDRHQRNRFAEQGWLFLYAAIFWPLGVYIVAHSPYYRLVTPELFRGYPHFALTPLTKFYYLVQTSFWLHQVISLNIEKRRKDFFQMFTHHIITILLVVTSYATNFTRVGTAILVAMDFTDIILPLAKMIKYAGYENLADLCFGFFMISWMLTRHLLFGGILYTTIVHAHGEVDYAWDPPAGKFGTRLTINLFLVLLFGLQGLLIWWFAMIAKVAYRVLCGQKAEDIRSDSEEDAALEESEPEEVEEDHLANGVANGTANGMAHERHGLRQRRQ